MTTALTPDVADHLEQLAKRSRWSRSTAAAVAIERGLEVIEAESASGREQLLAG